MIIRNGNLICKTLIILYLVTYFIPSFYSIDRIGNQWLYLSIISLISISFILFYSPIHKQIKSIAKRKSIIIYFIFILWGLFSILYSYNKAEALVTFNQYFTVFVSFFIINILLIPLKNPTKFLLSILMVSLFLEVLASIIPIFNDIEKGVLKYRSRNYAGVAANVNITAFSLLYKTPILLYFFSTERRVLIKVLYLIFFTLILLAISVLGTRSAFICVGVCFISFIIYIFQTNNKLSFKIKHILPIFGSILIIIFLSKIISTNETDIISRASTIRLDTKDGSVNQRLRYYKQGIDYFFKNPIIGSGIGNWKILSIKYDKNDIDGYIVPYHAHNDFIQLLVELGVFGLLLYSLFIFFSLKKLFSFSLFADKINYIYLGIAGIYFIDSMLNFPIARPISQLFLIFFISLISVYKTSTNEK
tara:strand:- start:360 stop:1616 length:1257 start_codon:yes stop_codon:yes gene_type:complete